jgi:predicted SprT family Zn-dependent metalloprotease
MEKSLRTTKVRRKKRAVVPDELHHLRLYVRALRRHGVSEDFIREKDLENEFYWYFELQRMITLAYAIFDRINDQHFAGALPKPLIAYCTRSTGGFYNKRDNHIGISMGMTVEHGEQEFIETVIHEIGHMKHSDHSPKFYALIRSLGASGKKAPMTRLLQNKRANFLNSNYPVEVECPSCKVKSRFKTRRALLYACKKCCDKFNAGKFDPRFKFVLTPSPVIPS